MLSIKQWSGSNKHKLVQCELLCELRLSELLLQGFIHLRCILPIREHNHERLSRSCHL